MTVSTNPRAKFLEYFLILHLFLNVKGQVEQPEDPQPQIFQSNFDQQPVTNNVTNFNFNSDTNNSDLNLERTQNTRTFNPFLNQNAGQQNQPGVFQNDPFRPQNNPIDPFITPQTPRFRDPNNPFQNQQNQNPININPFQNQNQNPFQSQNPLNINPFQNQGFQYTPNPFLNPQIPGSFGGGFTPNFGHGGGGVFDSQGGYHHDLWNNGTSFVKYLAISPSLIQPDSLYTAVVTIISTTIELENIDVWLSLAKDGVDLQGSNKLIAIGETDSLQILVPRRLTAGEYKIRLEGNYPGSQGGTLFLNETTLAFSEKFLSILIQTNRYVFNGGQKVGFRIILLKRDLLPFEDNIEVYILDARGFIMRRWPSVASNFGVVDLVYELPEYSNLGKWKVKVEAGIQIEEKEFVVEKYFQPQYEIYVSLPPFILNTEEKISAKISGFYGSEKTVRGNATVSLYAFSYEKQTTRVTVPLNPVLGFTPDLQYTGSAGQTITSEENNREYIYIGSQFLILNGEETAEWDLREVMGIARYPKLGLRVEADVTEFFLEEPRFGFAESRIIQEQLQLKFLKRSPLIFKPGLPFECVLIVSYKDLERVSSEILQKSVIRVFPQAILENGGRAPMEPIEVHPPGYNPRSPYPGSRYYEQNLYDFRVKNDENDENDEENLIDPDLIDAYYRFKPINEKMEDFYGHTRNAKYWKDGYLQVKFIVPKGTSRLLLQADYSDQNGNTANTQTFAYSTWSPARKYISVSTTSRFSTVDVGGFVILTVNSNFKMDQFYWMVSAKGLIVQKGREILETYWSLPRSLSIPVSPDMAPGFRVLVYTTYREREVISDSIFIPVDKITRHNIELRINDNKDRKRDTLEFTFLGEPAAYFASSAQRSVREFMQSGNELTKKTVFETLHSLEPFNKSIHQFVRRNRNGEEIDQILYFPSMNYGVDTNRTMNFSQMLIFTNLDVPLLPTADHCWRENEVNCATEGCYLSWQRCDGQINCGDSSDEEDCEDLEEEDMKEYRVNRISRYLDFYDPSDGDWAWTKENIAHGGDYILTRDVPKITDSWHIHAFAVSKTNGFAFIEDSIYYETTRPFMMALDAPASIKRGEQVGIFAILYNKMEKDIFVWLTLKGSDDYKMVQVDEDGSFDYKKPEDQRFTSGDHQHFVWIPASSELEVRFAVRPTIDQGTMEVKIEATTQMRSDTSSVEIEVLAEGVQIAKHTSLLLDLKSRAVVLKFIDIFTEETPIIPYELQRKYVYGSPAGHVTLSGDVMGPIFPEDDIGMSMNQMMGRAGKGTADRVFDMAANVWGLHYLRLTNKLPNSQRRKILVEINKIFAHIMKRFRPRGYFKMWNISKPSVWLSAWVLQIFRHASFQDWENEFYVEPRIFTLVIRWILQYQNWDGSFKETFWYQNPLHKRMGNNNPNGPFNITLTAHVAITLQEVLGFLEGGLRVEASIAKSRSVQYLETHLTKLDDPYELAITAYALTLCDSAEKELAFGLLNQKKIDDHGFIYWSPDIMPTNEIIWENNRPFIQPKNNEYWDSLAVEASSYALLTYLVREGVTMIPEKIASWLNSMRLTDGAFISTIDTSVALQALCEYANRARLRDITQMHVNLEVASTGNVSNDPFQVNFDNIEKTQSFDISSSDAWGFVNVIARGSGQAVVQLDLTYGVDWEEFKDTPPKECFELKVREIFSERRNKSSVTYETCFKWLLTEESQVSGATVLEVEIPSGYGMIQADAIEVVTSGVHPLLRDALMQPGKTSWYFDYIPSYETCFSHTVNRWYPVANLTTHKSAIIYEAYAPERFQITMFNDTSLRDLDICQVCGSYQCPYCPFYSTSVNLRLDSTIFYLTASVLCLLIYTNFPSNIY